jgi:hypothetical protein
MTPVENVTKREIAMSPGHSAKPLLSGVLLSCALAVLAPAVAPAQESTTLAFLRKVIQLDDGQLTAVEKGEVVTKQLHTTDKHGGDGHHAGQKRRRPAPRSAARSCGSTRRLARSRGS